MVGGSAVKILVAGGGRIDSEDLCRGDQRPRDMGWTAWAGRHDLLQDAEASGNMSLNVQPNAVRKVYLVFHGHEFRFMREIKESSIKGHMRNPLLVSIIHVQEQKAGYVSSIIIKYRYIRVVIHPPH